MSALPLEADMLSDNIHVRYVPLADIAARASAFSERREMYSLLPTRLNP
jgi:hypothetical protein